MTAFPESHRDLLDGQFATLATLGRDGIPQLTEVWFLHDDGELKISLNTSRLKTRNLRRRPECSLFLLDLSNPYRYMDVRGRARIEPDDDYAFADGLRLKGGGGGPRGPAPSPTTTTRSRTGSASSTAARTCASTTRPAILG